MKKEYTRYFQWKEYRRGSNNYVRVDRLVNVTCDGHAVDCLNGVCKHIKKIVKTLNPVLRRGLK